MNKKMLLALVALLAAIGLMLGVYFATRPQPRTRKTSKSNSVTQTDHSGATDPTDGSNATVLTDDSVSFTITVVHADGSQKTFTIRTEALYLGEALLDEGLIVGKDGPYGLDVSHVDGEKAVWAEDNAYWALYVGEEYATTGVSTTPVYEGSVFKYVYTPA